MEPEEVARLQKALADSLSSRDEAVKMHRTAMSTHMRQLTILGERGKQQAQRAAALQRVRLTTPGGNLFVAGRPIDLSARLRRIGIPRVIGGRMRSDAKALDRCLFGRDGVRQRDGLVECIRLRMR